MHWRECGRRRHSSSTTKGNGGSNTDSELARAQEAVTLTKNQRRKDEIGDEARAKLVKERGERKDTLEIWK